MTPTHERGADLDRRSYLQATGIAVAGAVGLAGCSAVGPASGTLATRVTDQPGDIADFESCVVTIQGIWLKPSESDGATETAAPEETDGDGEAAAAEQSEADVDESDGREYHEFDEPQEADLVHLQNGKTSLIDERDIETGRYEFLQLDVSDVDGVLADGGDQATVDTPGNAPLQFNEAFEIREDQTTTFTGDFTPVKRGRTERYVLQPVPRGITVEYDAEETATGTETDA